MKIVAILAALAVATGGMCVLRLQLSASDRQAPELIGSKWFNTESDKPVRLSERKGRVTVVHFWTFACTNCKANLPAYSRLYEKFKAQGVVFVGVHSPELDFEKVDANVKEAVGKLGITYPVLIDTDGTNWKRWKQEVWPTVYVVDKNGNVVFRWVGELGWNGANGEAQVSTAIQRALSAKS